MYQCTNTISVPKTSKRSFSLQLIFSLFQVVCGVSLTVSPQPPHIISSVGDSVTLRCSSSVASSICLWKTPYQAIYSVGGGRVWEEGRLTSISDDDSVCSLVISSLEARYQRYLTFSGCLHEYCSMFYVQEHNVIYATSCSSTSISFSN